MSKLLGLLALTIMAAASPTLAAEEMATLKVTNAASRFVDCTIVVDSHSDRYVRIQPGKTYTNDYGARRQVQLVCNRGRKDSYGPLKLGVGYRLVDDGARVGLVEDAEPPAA